MEIKIEDLLRKIAELEHQLSKALARIEELEKETEDLLIQAWGIRNNDHSK